MRSIEELSQAVKAAAIERGFARVGIALAGPVPHGEPLREWLARGLHGNMSYMARNLEKRLQPDRLVDGAQSVICLAATYPSESASRWPGNIAATGLVARYARGQDYHKVLKRKCVKLMDRIRRVEPAFEGRAFVDSAPVMERSLAAAAGLGWIGRNGCLVVPGLGSYALLCEIVCNLPLAPDAPIDSQCRNCGACIAACPTGALVADGLVDARRCISYLTIEHKGAIDRAFWPAMGCRVFGCDACQEACPHNRRGPSQESDAREGVKCVCGEAAHPAMEALGRILGWEEADWDAATRGSATRRATYEMFLRNAVVAAGNSGQAALIEPLRKLLCGQEKEGGLVEAIQWACRRLGASRPDGAGPRPCPDKANARADAGPGGRKGI